MLILRFYDLRVKYKAFSAKNEIVKQNFPTYYLDGLKFPKKRKKNVYFASVLAFLFFTYYSLKMNKTLPIFFFLSLSFSLFAQIPTPTLASERLKSAENRKKTPSQLQLSFRNIGPTIMSGRVVDVEVNENDPSTFYAAFASGGLWKTVNNGADFKPLFDNEGVMTIGDIAVDWKNGEKIWIGTGECNASRSSYSGTGIYYSENGGKTWEHRGLEETHHIGRVLLHPTNPNILWVAAIGHLYSKNEERGVFKTVDGGKTWQKTLFVNDSTGAIDIIIDPKDENILYASTWTRSRYAWNFNGKGSGSGIYKSANGGDTWELLSTKESGFPSNEKVGRIGLSMSFQNSQIVYAVVDNQNHREKDKNKEDKKPTLTKDALKTMTKEAFLKLDEETINQFLDYYNFEEEYEAKGIIKKIKDGKLQPVALSDYLEDADNDLFDTPIVGAEIYRSEDGGKTWKRTHDKYIDNLFYTYGYYFAQIRVSPINDKELYVLGVPILYSPNGGKTWQKINKENVHPDNHALWLNPKKSGHFIVGNDGGINITYDNGANYFKMNNIPVGQFYAIAIDSAKPYNVYGGLQDNGVWRGNSQNIVDKSWQEEGEYPFKSIMGGDGMQVQVDTRDNQTVYTGYQFGNYFRINKLGTPHQIQVERNLGEPALRFNWQSPIALSVHNQDILYFGAQKLYRSMDKGNCMKAISEDLTNGKISGNVPYGTTTTISESPLEFGLLYVGTDDGKVHLTKDNGTEWKDISAGLPARFWVSRVIASKYEKARVYVALNGYRWDNFEAQVYVSENFGETWTRIGLDLPTEAVNVIREDPNNPQILYVGTDNGVYVSLNQGKNFLSLNNSTLPNVAVHDLLLHPTEKELILGTHGRSLYIASVAYLEQLSDSILNKELHIFSCDSITYNKNWGKLGFDWTVDDTPTIAIHFYQKNAVEVKVRILSEKNVELFQTILPSVAGLRSWVYNGEFSAEQIEMLKTANKNENFAKDIQIADNGKVYLPPGKYTVELSVGSAKQTCILKVKKPKEKAKRGRK